MKNMIPLLLLFTAALNTSGQTPAHVEKKSREFIVDPSKSDYSIIGYQYANVSTKKMICFSNNSSLVREYDHDCPLGAYFDTNHLKVGDNIYWLGNTGSFAKMNFIHGNGQKTVFYIPKSSFVVK